MTSIMVKLKTILKLECMNTWEFQNLLERVKDDSDSVIRGHLFCDHLHNFDNFSILATKNNNFIKLTSDRVP